MSLNGTDGRQLFSPEISTFAHAPLSSGAPSARRERHAWPRGVRHGAAVLVALGAVGCTGTKPESPITLGRSAEQLTFEEWKSKARVARFGDVYAVGDYGVSPFGLVGEAAAREYYEHHFADPSALTVDNGQLDPLASADPSVGSYPPGATLKYCIDRPAMRNIAARFELPGNPDLYAFVDSAFATAAAAWTTVAGQASPGSGLTIQKAVGREDSCFDHPGDDITWYVTTTAQPTVAGSSLDYLTFALGPKYFGGSPTGGDLSRRYFLLNDYILQSFFPGAFHFLNDPNWSTIFSINGLMLHGIASGLGFIGEENRQTDPEAWNPVWMVNVEWPTPCRDTSIGGVFLTEADPASVTLQPLAMQPYMGVDEHGFDRAACTGFRSYDYAITYSDAMGAACQYRKDAAGVASVFFYCNQLQQVITEGLWGATCSPVPVSTAGDCQLTTASPAWDANAEADGRTVLAALLGVL